MHTVYVQVDPKIVQERRRNDQVRNLGTVLIEYMTSSRKGGTAADLLRERYTFHHNH
jgi:hypothetical protein